DTSAFCNCTGSIATEPKTACPSRDNVKEKDSELYLMARSCLSISIRSSPPGHTIVLGLGIVGDTQDADSSPANIRLTTFPRGILMVFSYFAKAATSDRPRNILQGLSIVSSHRLSCLLVSRRRPTRGHT